MVWSVYWCLQFVMCNVAVAMRRECQAAEPGRQRDPLLGVRKERALNHQGDYPQTDATDFCIPRSSVASGLLLLFVNMSQFKYVTVFS